MRESFVFYRSFWEILEELDDPDDWREFVRAICKYSFDGEQPNFKKTVLRVAFKHFQISCDNASARYEKAIENGKKGGRPTKQEYIPPAVWIPKLLEIGSVAKTAEHFQIAKRTLYYWISQIDDERLDRFKNVQKCKNLSDSVSDSVSESDTRKDIYNNAATFPATDPNGSRESRGTELTPEQRKYYANLLIGNGGNDIDGGGTA